MSDELKRLEVELARVRLAKEQLELRDALQRAERKQRIADTADTLVDAGRRAAKSSAAAVAQRTPSAPVAWSKIVVIAGLALLLFATYLAGLPESKSNLLVVAFFAAAALGLYALVLLLKKLLQLTFHRE